MYLKRKLTFGREVIDHQFLVSPMITLKALVTLLISVEHG